MMICPRCMRQFEDDVEQCPDDGLRLRAFRDQTSQLVGVVLDGRWKIEAKIGEGGMGEVYRARQVNVDRVVAIKVLRLALASTEQYVARFFREADIATSVKHPHFVTIYDFGQTADQVLYIAMELLDGEPMSVLVKRRRLDLLEALTIASQVSAALAAAHDARIVHRDLKPDNIFLIEVPGGDTFVKVLDFGIAKDLDSEDKVTKTGQLFGTPEYMSPEQCEGSGRVDGRSDLYALGCILYEVLSGRSPFQRDSIIQTLMAHVSDEPKSFGELGIPVPAGVEEIVLRLLEKHPDDRFASAIAVRKALMDEIEHLRTNSGEIHVYETVSAGIKPRDHAAQTVSYSELAHPLQLEGVLASSARGAIKSQAAKRRESDSEKSTENVRVRAAGANRQLVAIMVGAIVLALLFVGYLGSQRPPEPDPPQPVAVDPAVMSPSIAAATAEATAVAEERALESVARRQASAVALTAVTVALAKPTTKKASKRDEVGIGIRTQKSMNRRIMKSESALLRCYNRREDTADGGDVNFVFEIADNGLLASSDVSSTALTSATVIKCMQRVVARLRFFPASRGARFEKTLRFNPPK